VETPVYSSFFSEGERLKEGYSGRGNREKQVDLRFQIKYNNFGINDHQDFLMKGMVPYGKKNETINFPR
jgi:hypothetical protein